jgi:manganese transport protein
MSAEQNKNSPSLPNSLPEVYRTVKISDKVGLIKRLLAFSGPAFLISVGYMDPGNWATDIEGGARFNMQLIWVLLMANLMAVLVQTLSARLGIVSGRDLAQACRENYSKPLALVLWVLCEIAIAACDLAEVLGTAIGLNLLFGLDLLWGVLITALDTLLLLVIQRWGIRKMEAFILSLITVVGLCFVLEIFLAKPQWGQVIQGFVPRLNDESLYVAIAILGATVMPHNIYLHSALVQTRAVEKTPRGLKEACRSNLIDSAVALNAAFFINAAILIMSASVFFRFGRQVTEIQQAHELLTPILGTSLAGIAFAVALLCAGQSSTLTGTLSGQVVMEGFLHFRMRPWLRRLITRAAAIVPAALTIMYMGSHGTYKLLILSQVILSLQLPFAVIPLVHFTSDRRLMGEFATPKWAQGLAWLAAVIITGLNVWLIKGQIGEWLLAAQKAGPMYEGAIRYLLLPAIVATAILLVWITFKPWLAALLKLRIPVPAPYWVPLKRLILPPAAPVLAGVQYRRIAVALDRTPADEYNLGQAVALAKPYGADLILIHITDSVSGQVFAAGADDLHARDDRAYLDDLAGKLKGEGLKVETRLGFGNPSDELVKLVEQEKFDLLIMGSHGHRGMADLIFGETVAPVQHRVTVPILVVPQQK